MKTAVIYARYSSDSQTEQSIEGQVRVCKQFAEKNDLLVVDQYIDRATTGMNDNRAAFQQMLRDSKRRQWSVVIVYKLDRFARNKYESVVNRKKLTDNGVELVSAMENIPDTPEGKLFLAVIEGFNEYFSEDLKQKVNRGLRESWLKGNATGGKDIFGWDLKDKKYHINEAEASVIREIFQKYAQGYKAQTIADELKEKNFRRKNGQLITHKFVYRILHDRRYTGVVTHKGEEFDKIFPPIISRELWTQVNAINEENKNAPGRKKEIFDYILSGKLICGKCKHRMVGESGTSKTGEIHYYYSCLSKRRKQEDCDCKAVKKQVLEDYVIQATVAMLRRNSIITRIAETVVKVHEKMMQDDSGLQVLIKKRDDTKKAADNIVKAIEQGIIMDFTKDRLNGLQAELNELEIEINKAAQKSYAHLSVEEVEKFLLSKVFEDPDDIKVRKLLVNTFVREVIWYGDNMVITYNFQERFSTERFSKSYVEDIEKQVEEQSRSASSFSLSSYKVTLSAPNEHSFYGCSFILYRLYAEFCILAFAELCTRVHIDPERDLDVAMPRQTLTDVRIDAAFRAKRRQETQTMPRRRGIFSANIKKTYRKRRNSMDLKQMRWTRAPKDYAVGENKIEIVTAPHTDLWQRTYYHFRNDSAPVLQMRTAEKFFSFTVRTRFESKKRFDQCGIALYIDSENWLKASIEYENEQFQHLGSVVTVGGYSDWATTAIDASVKSMWYRLSRREDDFCIECSTDGVRFSQMRICHMPAATGEIPFGIYACSPEDSSFRATFTDFTFGECLWKAHVGQPPDKE